MPGSIYARTSSLGRRRRTVSNYFTLIGHTPLPTDFTASPPGLQSVDCQALLFTLFCCFCPSVPIENS